MVATFTIPGRLPSLNDFIRANRTGPHVGAQMKRDSEVIVGMAIKEAHLQPIEGPVRVEFGWYEPTARRDADNISGYGRKVILDSLVQCGVIEDDSQRFVVGLADCFGIDKDNPRIEVTIQGGTT